MRLGFGCVNLGSAARGRTVRADERLVQEAVDRGVTTFDTADVYGSGASERVLGRALRHRRSQVVLATKAGYTFRERTLWEQAARRRAAAVVGHLRRRTGGGGRPGGGVYADQDFSPTYLRGAVDASLRRLRTDHLDVLQFHAPGQLIPELIPALDDLVVAGKVRRFGVGSQSVEAAAEWSAIPGLGVVQVPFGVLDPEASSTVFPVTHPRPIEVWVRGVLGGGLLTAAVRDPAAVAGDPKHHRIEGLRRIAHEAGLDLYQLAVGFVRAYADEVAVLLLGISSREHLARNLELIGRPPLASDVVAEILRLAADTDSGRHA